MDKRIGKFLQAIGDASKDLDPDEFWPLNGAQVNAYFSDVHALEIYALWQELKKKRVSLEKMAKLLKYPVILRYFLGHTGIVGLKVVRKLKLATLSKNDQLRFTGFIFDLLTKMTLADQFCRDGKDILWSKAELAKTVRDLKWEKASVESAKAVQVAGVDCYGLVWALFYNLFVGAGLQLHGPYDVSNEFGPDTWLIVKDFYDLKPVDIWPVAKKVPVSSVQFYQVIQGVDWGVNFYNQPVVNGNLVEGTKFFAVVADGENFNNFDKMTNLGEELSQLTGKQSSVVEGMKPLDQVRKGAEIMWLTFKPWYDYLGKKCQPSGQVEQNIKNFGLEFIKKYQKSASGQRYWVKLFDPRNLYY